MAGKGGHGVMVLVQKERAFPAASKHLVPVVARGPVKMPGAVPSPCKDFTI